MEKLQYTTVIIKAAEGHYITNVSDDIDIKDRIIATSIALGKFDSADNYKEITSEEAEALKQQQTEIMMADIEANK